jgi:HlyD family secretion protein
MKINETAVLLAAAQAKLQQRFVYATHSGTILTLYTRQTGEFVQPGQAIAEIAPAGEPLILSTLLPSHEAGFVKPGMVVKVKLDAFPYQEFGIVPGKVLSVSLDSKTTEQGNQVYRVDVELDRHAVNGRGQKVSFKSGQTATAEIVTRHRRMADVLLDPIKQLQGNGNL